MVRTTVATVEATFDLPEGGSVEGVTGGEVVLWYADMDDRPPFQIGDVLQFTFRRTSRGEIPMVEKVTPNVASAGHGLRSVPL